MTDLSILRRAGDAELMKVTRTDDAFALAAQLAEGHPFEMQVVAIYPCSGYLFEKMSLPGHVKSNWYRTGLASLIATVATHVAASLDEHLGTKDGEDAVKGSDTLEEEDCSVESDATAKSGVGGADLAELFASVEVCSKSEMGKATDIRKALVQKHGKVQATLLLAPLKEAVLKGPGGGKQRLYTYQGQPLRLK